MYEEGQLLKRPFEKDGKNWRKIMVEDGKGRSKKELEKMEATILW